MPEVNLTTEEWQTVVTILAMSNPLIAKIQNQVQQQNLESADNANRDGFKTALNRQ